MRIRIHRGSHEIGGSCVEIEAEGRRILVDAGLPLDVGDNTVPAIPDLEFGSLCATVISHSHRDHYGLLPWLPSTPVVMGTAARRILMASAPFMQKGSFPMTGPDLADRRPLQVGPFRITPYLVDHSAYDAYALLIEACGKRVFYSGDFRIHGRKQQLVERLLHSPPSDIDVLLLEGTTLGATEHRHAAIAEDDLEAKFIRVFRDCQGLALVHASSQNVDRLVTIYRACLQSGRTLVIDLYTAMVLEATGNPSIPQSDWERVAVCIPLAQRIQIKRNGWFADLKRHTDRRIYADRHLAKTPKDYVLLFRPLWMGELERYGCLADACLIHSQWQGYLTETRFQNIDEWRRRHGMGFHEIHTSGHASPADLKRFAKALAPKRLVPIHSNCPDSYVTLYPDVEQHTDGEWWEV